MVGCQEPASMARLLKYFDPVFMGSIPMFESKEPCLYVRMGQWLASRP